MARLIGIDYGQKRVGIATTDPLHIIATALTTIGVHEVFQYLQEYVDNEEVEGFVVGFPRQLDHSLSESAKYVSTFLTGLKRKFPHIPVFEVDERFTSKMAFQTMIDGGLRKKARQDKAMIDKISATIILQSYLEQQRNNNI